MKLSVSVKLNKDFIRFEDGKLIVGVKARPEKGRANEEVVKKIARHFKVSIAHIRIMSGRNSRKKWVEIN